MHNDVQKIKREYINNKYSINVVFSGADKGTNCSKESAITFLDLKDYKNLVGQVSTSLYH